MSNYMIQINDEEISRQIRNILDTILKSELQTRCSQTGDVIADAIKDLVYKHKDEILDRIVNKATAELVKRGLPKLIETFTMTGETKDA